MKETQINKKIFLVFSSLVLVLSFQFLACVKAEEEFTEFKESVSEHISTEDVEIDEEEAFYDDDDFEAAMDEDDEFELYADEEEEAFYEADDEGDEE